MVLWMILKLKGKTLDGSLDDFTVGSKNLKGDIRAGDGKIRCF